ncbi:MAG: hypothetical protein H7Z72_19215 [Bacteroidetes bacterium]|nr:hypothetical protein [Fibrella sp.]
MASLSNPISTHRRRRLFRAGWLLVGLFASQASRAQQVQVVVNVLPPYSAYIQDYASSVNKVQIFVRNTTAAPVSVRLQASVTGDNGVTIATLPNYRPPVPLRLGPLENKLLTRADLEGLFDLNQIAVEGMDKNRLYRGLPLPDGQYQLCVQVFDNATSRPLSADFPLGCSPPFPVKAIEPPILIAPFCDSDVLPTTPQATVFTWSPPAGLSPAQVSYTLRIIELPLQEIDPNVFIDAVNLPPSGIEVKNLPTSTFLYGPQYLPLKPGKRYAWRVQAVDRSGRINLLNDGKSPVCAFRYGPATAFDSLGTYTDTYLAFVKPGEEKGKTLPVLTTGYGNPLFLNWDMATVLADQLVKKQAPRNLPAGMAPTLTNPVLNEGTTAKRAGADVTAGFSSCDLTMTNLSYRVRIKTLLKGKPFETVLDRQVKTPYLSVETGDLPPGLKPGKSYWAEVELMGLTDGQRKTLSLPVGPIAAEPRRFALVQKNTGNQSDTVYIKGTLAFKYPGEDGEGHLMPNTLVQLKRVEKGGYENNMGFATTNAQGEFTVAVPRWEISKTDTLVTDKTTALSASINGQTGATKTTKDTAYYNVGYRIVPGNIYLLPAEQTFTVSHKQVGTMDAGRITVLVKGYRVSITARQAYKNWPGAPDVNLAGKTLVLFRKPNKQVDPYVLPIEGQRELYSVKANQTLAGSPQATQSVQNAGNPATLVAAANSVNGGIINQQLPGSSPAIGVGAGAGSTARTEVEKAGYQFVGTTTLVADGSSYKANLERLLYSYNPLDRYAVYCPDCGQQPDDAETFRFNAPPGKLSPVLARTESYTFTVQTTEAPTMTFSGKLNYKFADKGIDGAQAKPLGNTRVHLQVVYRNAQGGPFSSQVPNHEELTAFHKDFSATLGTAITGDDGSFTIPVKLTKPLFLGTLPPTALEGSGELAKKPTTFIRAVRVVVDNPYYASPSATFGDSKTEQMVPQGSYDFGSVTAVVRSYSLAVEINSDTTGLSGVEKQSNSYKQQLAGVKIFALRALRKGAFPLSPDAGPPLDEGKGVPEVRKFGTDPHSYTVVAQSVSNAQGGVVFPRMVMANGADDAYFIATESSVVGQNNYSLNGPLKRITTTEDYGDQYSTTPNDAQKKLALEQKKVNKVPGSDCKIVWHVKLQNQDGTHYAFDLDETKPGDQANIESYKKALINNPNNKSGSSMTPETVCKLVDNYWVGQGLRDVATNSQVLIGNPAKPEFADDYVAFTSSTVKRFLKPGQPSITLRVVDKTNPLTGVSWAQVRLYDGEVADSKLINTHWSSSTGYVTPFINLKPGINAILTIQKDGYIFSECKYYDPATNDTLTKKPGPKLEINLGKLLKGQNVYIDRVLMQPNTRILGLTVDADTAPGSAQSPVEAYVQVDNGLYYKSKLSGGKAFFDAYAPGTNADSLKLFPVNISYFNEYRLIKNLPKPTDMGGGQFIIDAGVVPVFQRDHRIDFILIDKLTGKPVKGGLVKLFGRDDKGFAFGPSDAVSGLVETQFKNVSVENLFVEVSALGYVTKTQSVTNTESKTAKPRPVLLEPASLIKGTVVLKGSDGKETPLPGAEVFVAGGSNAQTPYSTTAGPGGAFTLAVGKQLADVTIQVTYRETGGVSGTINLDGSGQGFTNTPGQSYTGATEKNYGLPQAKNASLKLTLTAFTKFKIATIWGFPVKVESLTALANGTARVSGEVELSSAKFGPFAVLDPDVRVRFENVIFKPGTTDPTVGEPVSVNVPLKTGILDNLGYYSKASYKAGDVPLYNVRLTATGNFLSGGNLQIVRSAPNESTGVVMAQAQIIDNSFQFSENLLSYEKGQFFLYDPAASGQPGTQPVVVAFRSGGGAVKRTNFGICTKDGQPIKLQLLAFNATSSLDGSRLKGDEIHLNPTLTCTLKNANPNSLTVNVGDLVLKNNTVDAKSGQTPLTFTLANKWSVEVRNWVLDYKQGGFYSTEGVVKTGKADIPISLFNLRADFFKLDAQPTQTLGLAGLANVTLGGKGYFGYDEATGSDMKGHWALVVVPDGNKPAGVLSADAKLPGLTDKLEFETISLLDNGEDVFSFGASSQSVNFYKGVMTVRPKTIETGADYFAIDAGMSTTIPNAPKDVPVKLTYYRPNGNGPVTLKTIIPGDYVIDTKGQVQFVAGVDADKKAFYFADGVMAIRGMAREKDKLQLGLPGDVKTGGVVLVHSVLNGGYTFITNDRDLNLNDPAKVEQLVNYYKFNTNHKPLQIDLGGKAFSSVRCSQEVKKGQWDLLTFSGIPKGFAMLGEDEKNRLTFTNYGSIQAENQKLKVDELGGSDGFPGLSLEYDMANSRFTGTITLPPNMPLPPTMTVEQGVAQVRIDGNGFYLAAAATVRDVPLIVPVTMKAGIMLGYYASNDFADAEAILFGNTHRKALPCAFKQTFKGVFVNGEIPLPLIDNFENKYSFGFGSVKTGLNAYMDGYVFGNYDQGAFTFGTGLGMGLRFYAYGSVLNVSASGEVTVDGASQFDLTYEKAIKKVTMDAKVNMGAGFSAAVDVDLGVDSYSTSTPEMGFCLKMNYPQLSYTVGKGISISKPSFGCEFNKCTGDCSQ